jgi:hypothetical protein
MLERDRVKAQREARTRGDISLPGDNSPRIDLWAIGVGIHGIRALSSSEDDYHHELERTARLERKRHRRRSMVRRTVDDGADLLLKTCASLHERVRVENGMRLDTSPGSVENGAADSREQPISKERELRSRERA